MAFLLFFTAIILSGIAAYYSVIGLTAIFAAAAIPVAIMGVSLEVAKLVVASWLYRFWKNIPFLMKAYFTTALVVLMLITSMGIFGYLSKAHLDQSLVSGDVIAKIAVYDEKIKTEKENIEANRKALKQMDEGVDQVLGRSTTETGADKAVAMRKSQQKERGRLQAEISQSQKSIAGLNNERAPIASEVRKVEAEVGPIKYIAALVYGDNSDSSSLEKAVRGLIIMLVFVFDPLAVLMLIAANLTQIKQKEEKDDEFLVHKTVPVSISDVAPESNIPAYEKDDGPLTDDQVQQIKDEVEENSLNWKLEIPTTTITEPVVTPEPTTTPEPAHYKIIPEEAVIPVALEDTVTEEIETPEESLDEDKAIVINEDLTVDKNVEQQVETMIENNDHEGLEAVYKKIVKELAKQNRKKSTHWNSK
jgi:hypothetical protein